MNSGRCLCGKVSWELLAEPFYLYNCHCRMCQKVHGAAFATYAFVHNNEFRWTGSTDSIVEYKSSEALTRGSCNVCGSVVPYQGQNKNRWVAPAGCHDQMRKPDYNIFVVDNAPWHTISGNLPESDGYPEEAGSSSVEGIEAPGKTQGDIKGSCLCGEVTFKVTEPFKMARNCHCSRCRHGRAAAHASNVFTSHDAVEFVTGENNLIEFKVPDARFFTQVFCKVCSSLMPRKDATRGMAVLPMGSLDHDPLVRPSDHIFVNHKAGWHDITDGLPQHPEGPPPA